jgi:hypothetical protein
MDSSTSKLRMASELHTHSQPNETTLLYTSNIRDIKEMDKQDFQPKNQAVI